MKKLRLCVQVSMITAITLFTVIAPSSRPLAAARSTGSGIPPVTDSAHYSLKQVLSQIRDDIAVKRSQALKQSGAFTPKIALVLAGGGAAGSFQAGAVSAMAKVFPAAGLKLDLVVGTSVGAINALAVATHKEDLMQTFWSTVTLDDIVSGPGGESIGWALFPVRVVQAAPALVELALMGVLAFLQFLTFYWIFDTTRRNLRFLIVVTIIPIALVACARGAPVAFVLGTLIALGAALNGHRQSSRRFRRLLGGIWTMAGVAVVAVLAFIPAELYRALVCREGFFTRERLQHTVGRGFVGRVGAKAPSAGSIDDQIRAESRAVCQKGPAVSFVVTTTDVKRHSSRYFYLAADAETDRRALELGYTSIARQCPERLVDVAIASASVYPIFSPCRMELASGESPSLVDGGFLHNNPVQVAVSLGATHVLIIKPTRDQDYAPVGENLVTDVVEFFSALVTRSQTQDLNAARGTMSFLLQPPADWGKTNLGPLEFDGHRTSLAGLFAAPETSHQDFFDAGVRSIQSSTDGFTVWSRGPINIHGRESWAFAPSPNLDRP
jgi:predicted acylesterase/phospholipase RssA